jgi:hypothetical protein
MTNETAIYVCHSKFFGSVIIHTRAFSSAKEAAEFCNQENTRNKGDPDFIRCEFTSLKVT